MVPALGRILVKRPNGAGGVKPGASPPDPEKRDRKSVPQRGTRSRPKPPTSPPRAHGSIDSARPRWGAENKFGDGCSPGAMPPALLQQPLRGVEKQFLGRLLFRGRCPRLYSDGPFGS